MSTPQVHLVAGRDRSADIDAFAEDNGGRVGLPRVLRSLNRTAREVFATGSAATWAFGWDDEDNDSKRWWPQGITSSADASPSEEYAGRRLLVTTSYSKRIDGVNKGCRITVVDLADGPPMRYRHVLLGVVGKDDIGQPELRPLHAHAGGIVWSGDRLHVAATADGLHTFHLDDIVQVRENIGLGHAFVLPVRVSWAARTEEGAESMRYSFVSLGRDGERRTLLAGEYGHGRMTTRLLTFPLDAAGALAVDADGAARPSVLSWAGPARMQGAVSVDDRLHVVTSNGKRGKGSLWVGPSRELRRVARVLPPGPEDITYWPSREELWTVTEYPGRRLVLALDRKRFD
jgi:hypothetical protein